MSKQQEKESGSTFLPPDLAIKSKLDSIWTELQSNLPTISFDSNVEVLFICFIIYLHANYLIISK